MIGGLLGSVARASVQTSVGLTRAGVSTSSRLARGVLSAPLAVTRAAASVVGAPPRQVWSAQGRAQIEVRGLTGPQAPAVVAAVQDAVDTLPGVAWARVDVRMRRLVVRFDPARVAVEALIGAVEQAEDAAGVGRERYSHEEPGSPGDPGPVRQEALSLGADVAGLSAAVVGRFVRLPALPGGAAAAVVLVDYQPRLRRMLEQRLGAAGTDLALAASTAAVHGLTQGVPSLLVDTGQRAQSYLAARARRDCFTDRETDLCGPGRPLTGVAPAQARPVPLPAGPVEKLADRAAAGSLLTAGAVAALTGNLNAAGQAVVIGAPKAARSAREAFADTLAVALSRRGLLVLDPAALRRLDRVDTVLIDSAVLLGDRPLILDASAPAEGWTREHVWSAAQRLMSSRENELPIPPPLGRKRHRLTLDAQSGWGADGLLRLQLREDGRPVGDLVVGRELDPHADAVLSAAQKSGVRIILTADPSIAEIAARAHQVLAPAGTATGGWLAGQVRRLQAEGRVVAVLAGDPEALGAADVGIAILTVNGPVPWQADLLTDAGLAEVPRVLAAVPVAHSVSQRGATLAIGASFLGGLLATVGSGRRGGAALPVTLAAGSAVFSGTLAARRLDSQPDPAPVLHTPWHALETDEVLTRLTRSTAAQPDPATGGYTGPLVAVLPGALRVPARTAARLADNVRAELADPLTPVLATGAAASAVIGSPADALLVGGVLAANAVISGAQRLRADQALKALLLDQQLTARLVQPPQGNAEPAGEVSAEPADVPGADRPVRVVPANRLTPGDVIDLQPGDVVPADARLLCEAGLETDEASLTGESVAVGKQIQATPGVELADRACMVYEGTTVLTGTARAVVVAVGSATEAGRAVSLAGNVAGPAGMQARLEELTRRGLPVTLLGGAAVTGLGMLRGQSVRAAIGSGVSVAVAAVPEGLPLVATVAQLSAARRLSQRGVLVRSARTVEALGRVDTVCFDKTGTLTEGRLRLVRAAGLSGDWALDAPQAVRVLRAAARACPQPGTDQPLPHATDQAILDGARAALGELVVTDWEELSEVPFQSDRGFSAALGRTGDQLRLVVKGAPEVLLPRCTHIRDEKGKRRLTRASRQRAEDAVHNLAGQGLRVLAVARRTIHEPTSITSGDATDIHGDKAENGTEELAEDLTLLGFVALTDVARPQAAATIAGLQAAGLATVMITGDHPVTARAIAAGLGIPADRVITGPELSGLDDESRTRLVTQASVFARVSPEQKLRIIAGLQKAGRVVAMTGDGANDAAAIRLADVGIGMAAHGSSSARTAADLVFTEPDVSLILDALVEGRAMWRRVRDAVAILLGGNAGEVAFTITGTALGGRAPIGTRQFLLVNMLTDLLPAMAIALAATPSDPDARYEVLVAGPPSLGKPLLRDIGIRGATTAAGALTAWQIGRVTGRRRRADTIALAALVGTQLGQTLVVGGRNPLVIATGVGSALALAGIVQTPGVSQFFGCTPLGPLAWATVAGSSAAATALSVAAPHLLRPPHSAEPTRQQPPQPPARKATSDAGARASVRARSAATLKK